MRTSQPRPAAPRRPHRATAGLTAALLAGTAVLTGCAAEEREEAEAALQSTQERLDSVESRLAQAEDELDRKPDTEQLRSQAEDAASSAVDRARGAVEGLRSDAEGAARDAEGAVRDAVAGVPELPGEVDVEALEDQGRVVIEYGRDALGQDAAELERRAREAAEAARRSVPDLSEVEVKMGDRTFTF